MSQWEVWKLPDWVRKLQSLHTCLNYFKIKVSLGVAQATLLLPLIGYPCPVMGGQLSYLSQSINVDFLPYITLFSRQFSQWQQNVSVVSASILKSKYGDILENGIPFKWSSTLVKQLNPSSIVAWLCKSFPPHPSSSSLFWFSTEPGCHTNLTATLGHVCQPSDFVTLSSPLVVFAEQNFSSRVFNIFPQIPQLRIFMKDYLLGSYRWRHPINLGL